MTLIVSQFKIKSLPVIRRRRTVFLVGIIEAISIMKIIVS